MSTKVSRSTEDARRYQGININSRRSRILRGLVLAFATIAGLTFSLWSPAAVHSLRQTTTTMRKGASPADEWEDEWPYREQEPWDISTDFPYPRVLEYEVDEGTWLRLDVHPRSGEIVFDMLGDLYCLRPGSQRAHPILLGVPQDGDPHFSPTGDRLVFRSDAGLGVDNIWVTNWKDCDAAALRTDPEFDNRGVSLRTELLEALSTKSKDEALLASSIKESKSQRRRRLIREGRLHAQRVTNETYRFTSDARFNPSGTHVIVSKWYTSGRTIPASEGWQYEVPNSSTIHYMTGPLIRAGAGKRLIERTLPSGWPAEKYGDQQIGNEQFIWRGEDTLIYSKKAQQESSGIFSYSNDVHAGIYGIYSRNLTSGKTQTLVDPFPGGASRPELSRDGTTLAFVRRVRDKEALALLDLRSGSLHYLWYGLTFDATPIAATMGTYPSFAFTPEDDGIIIWAAGALWNVPLSVNSRGEKVSGGSPKHLPFSAKVEKRLAETLRGSTDIIKTETADTQRVHAFKELAIDDSGDNVLFQAAGVTYIQTVVSSTSSSQAIPVPVLDNSKSYYSPSFVPNNPNLVLHAKWSETNFTTFELANVLTGTVFDLSEGLPFGRYISPVLCECRTSERKLAFIRLPGDVLTGNVLANGGAGILMADVTLPHTTPRDSGQVLAPPPVIAIRNLQAIPLQVDLDMDASLLKLRFIDGAKKLLVKDLGRNLVIDLEAGSDELGYYKYRILTTAKTATNVAVAPRLSQSILGGSNVGVRHAAFVDFYHVYVVDGKHANGAPLRSKPGNATRGISRLSLDGGHDIAWSNDGKKLFWFLGPYLHYVEVAKLSACSCATETDPLTFGIACTNTLPTVQEISVHYDSDIARLSRDARSAALAARHNSNESSGLENSDVLAVINATLLTFDNGYFDADFIPGGTLMSKAGVITHVGPTGEIDVPSGAHVIDAHRGLVVPGYVDVHAHWSGFAVQHPTRSWELESFLAYGITTLHNPSSDNRDGFNERFLVESGRSLGPRIFHTGNIISGGGSRDTHQDIVNMDEARSALVRIRAEGGPSSFSYKNYQLPSRASRQRLLLAARNLSMLAVPEGGMSFDWDQTYIVDGMATIEHAIPIPVLYDDVLTLYAQSGTASTPTHIVNYGGAMGEQLVWAEVDVPNDPKLRRFIRHDILEGLTESTNRPRESYALFNTSASVAKLVQRGTLANIGAHGEPPLGLMYHAEMKFTQAGGLNAYEVLRTATRDGARSLGLFNSIGSLSPGKLADFVVYPEGVDYGYFQDLSPSKDPRFVVRGGRVFEARNLVEEWPVKGKTQVLPQVNAD